MAQALILLYRPGPMGMLRALWTTAPSSRISI